MGDTGYHPGHYPGPTQYSNAPRRSRSIFTMLREWWWESLSWLVGTCALAAIVGLLVYYRDKPVDSWNSQFGILRLATAIAALSQVAQTALMVSVSSAIGQLKWPSLRKGARRSDVRYFDEATRGAFGSVQLLWKLVTSGRL